VLLAARLMAERTKMLRGLGLLPQGSSFIVDLDRDVAGCRDIRGLGRATVRARDLCLMHSAVYSAVSPTAAALSRAAPRGRSLTIAKLLIDARAVAEDFAKSCPSR
jgi:hypothetical protein